MSRRRIAKRRIDAPPRVYENLVGEVFSGPGVGTTWKMPIRFLEKSGTPIFVSLTGEGGRKTVFQRSNRAEWIKRLLATLAWKEARVSLGYRDAVVWIGKTRFQPTSEDLKNFISEDEIGDVTSGVRVSAPRKRKVRTSKGDEEMAKKKAKKSKKSKKSEKSTGGRTPEERAKSNPSAYTCFLLGTTKKTNAQIGRKVRAKFPDCSDAYDEGTGVSYRRRAIAREDDSFAWVQEIPGFRMKNVLSHLEDVPERKASKKKSKKAKKGARKGVVKKVHKRPITKKSGRKAVHKVKRH